jgi:hypothetical protein
MNDIILEYSITTEISDETLPELMNSLSDAREVSESLHLMLGECKDSDLPSATTLLNYIANLDFSSIVVSIMTMVNENAAILLSLGSERIGHPFSGIHLKDPKERDVYATLILRHIFPTIPYGSHGQSVFSEELLTMNVLTKVLTR